MYARVCVCVCVCVCSCRIQRSAFMLLANFSFFSVRHRTLLFYFPLCLFLFFTSQTGELKSEPPHLRKRRRAGHLFQIPTQLSPCRCCPLLCTSKEDEYHEEKQSRNTQNIQERINKAEVHISLLIVIIINGEKEKKKNI